MFGSGRKILVVEDEAPVKELICTYLNREGFSVTEVADVTSAIRTLGTEFDVIVTSQLLAEGSSTHLVTAVKSRWPNTQVVVTTTSGEVHAAAEALASGADGYMVKPFGMPELRIQLVDCLAQRDRRLDEDTERRSTFSSRDKDDVRSHVEDGALALMRAAEAKDPSTVGHGEVVAKMAIVLTGTLDPDGRTLHTQAARLGALIHDIGKISLPVALLTKEGPLDADEWASMHTHPKVGRQLLAPLLRDATVEAAVTWHHEWWDGGGYPDGLAGDAIPLAARVTAIADALSAMTSPRSFRDARSFDDAAEKIRASFGTRYDPGLTAAFEAALPELRKAKAGLGSPNET